MIIMHPQKWMIPGYKAMRDVASAMFGVYGCSIASEFFFGSAIEYLLYKIEHYILQCSGFLPHLTCLKFQVLLKID